MGWPRRAALGIGFRSEEEIEYAEIYAAAAAFEGSAPHPDNRTLG